MKIVGYILENLQKQVYCSNEIAPLIKMKMKIKMRNRSHDHDENRSRHGRGPKYIKCKMCLSMMMLI